MMAMLALSDIPNMEKQVEEKNEKCNESCCLHRFIGLHILTLSLPFHSLGTPAGEGKLTCFMAT